LPLLLLIFLLTCLTLLAIYFSSHLALSYGPYFRPVFMMQFILFSLRFVFQQKFSFFSCSSLFFLLFFLISRWQKGVKAGFWGLRELETIFVYLFLFSLLLIVFLASVKLRFDYFPFCLFCCGVFSIVFPAAVVAVVYYYYSGFCCNCGNTHYLYLYVYFIVYSCKLQ